VQLAVAHVDGHHLACAALEQAVGEAAGRCAGVEGAPAVDVDGEPVERGIELLPAAPDEARRRSEQLDGLRRVDLPRRLGGNRAVDEDAAGGDVDLGALARRRQAAADELGVKPATQLARRLRDGGPHRELHGRRW
jgi:hypothetical protein